jgi:molybdopterin-guanine dinucleotide biosynthesis protein A
MISAMLTAFILAGGKSTRMGADKAFVELNGRTLLDRAIELAGGVADTVRLVGLRSRFAVYGDTVEDVFPERGPLGGIHAALTATTTELNLILAVDMPFVPADFLRYIVAEAERSAALVTVPCLSAGVEAPSALVRESRTTQASAPRSAYQPLCAVYRRQFGALAEAALRAGHNKIDRLFAPEHTRVIDAAEIATLSFTASIFDNLNTREELERAERR